ncbi:MAG TPA: NAD(P)H-dependent glycerol-3-phosphate dehydrogenase [Candidatus Acidoferrales bacterium]|nr:NAD(P)H-dependent glycerol-3-phosphate dehydrogenase [Candidatus Acidoferrales bacterium]
MRTIAIIGGGSWGTALALALSRSRVAHRLRLWVREEDLAARMQKTRENDLFLPGFRVPEEVTVTAKLEEAADAADLLLSVVPTQFLRAVWQQLGVGLSPSTLIVSATKGLEKDSLARPSEVIHEVLGPNSASRLAALSGPSFAREVAAGLPTAAVIASANAELARDLQAELASPALRLYTNSDTIGVEIGGAVKNIIAIAAGVCDGLQLGTNARAALMTRGLAEITRLAVACGGRAETLAGLAGLGDLVLTCTGALSRNRTVGLELAKGRRLKEIVGSMRMVAEGVETTQVTRALGQKLGVELPITEQMYRLLFEGQEPGAAVRELMERALREE